MSRPQRIAACTLLALLAFAPAGVRAQDYSPASLRLSDDEELSWDSVLVSQPAPAQPAADPPRPVTTRTTRTTRTSARDSYVRLTQAPNMFGDTIRPSPTMSILANQGVRGGATFDLLLAGGGSYNVAENNKAIPMDRAYFLYNGFYNAINFAGQTGLATQQSAGLHLYTAGFEKTFLDGLWSVDVRMPFTSGFQLATGGLATDSGHVGNLSVFLKRLAYSDDEIAVSGGLGMGLPTGSDVVTTFAADRIAVENEAVHLMPFLALTAMPNDDWFIQAFTQIDFATSGNEVTTNLGSFGRSTEQNLLHIDATLGRWLARDLDRRYLSGIAGIVELHYATTLQDTDTVRFNVPGATSVLSNFANRVDLLNLTAGLHFQIGALSNLRVGAVVPLRSAPDRVFDSEVQVSFNRMF